ncbi:hypothetical protein DVH24_035263 [Malus domestica]|uniref:Uncharacterized protein n=1 Tax=Malus domestica TaxID=3750 RepID=A0A498J402_MALDO|nr:hypothetical protein DVH24_035263 [Malus domestica]
MKEKLDLDMFLPFNAFHIADLGRSVGPNTFFSVENILEAVKFEYQSGKPALHLLSRVPKDVLDKNSRAWNKGRIHYSNNQDEVFKVYQTQYAEDMECFLRARALENLHRGLIVLSLLGSPRHFIEIVGFDQPRVISEEKVDSFKIPFYFVSPQELEVIVERNGCFSIERLETLPQHVLKHGTPGAPAIAKVTTSTLRAATEGFIKQQFGEEILDDLFSLYQQKLEDQISIYESTKPLFLFVVLKRKTN